MVLQSFQVMVEVAGKKRATQGSKRQRTENHQVAGKKKAITRGRKKRRIVNHDDGRRGWSDLPKELVELFMRRLLYVDQIYIRATCKSWHSVGRVPISLQKKQLPWLLGIAYKRSWTSCKLSDPTYKKTYTIDMSPLQIRALQIKADNARECCLHVHESKSGWLLLSASSLRVGKHQFIMYSPFLTSDNLLELPILFTRRLVHATFSHSNKYNGSSSYQDGFSFVALSYVPYEVYDLKISTCKLGDDNWTTTQNIHCHFQLDDITWLYSQGRFYYATRFGQVGSISIDGLEWGKLPPLARSLNRNARMTMSDEGELYLFTVCVKYSFDRTKSAPLYLDAYRLNLCSQPQSTTTSWERIESLGHDQALFHDRSWRLSPKLISNTPRETANRVYYCSGKEVLRTARYTIKNNSSRSYSCSKHFGSFSKETRYIKLWVEPPEY